MAAEPIQRIAPPRPMQLGAFQAESHARIVASWVRDEEEATRLAPRSAPPFSEDTIRNWAGPGRMQTVLFPEGWRSIVAYGELNTMETAPGEYWLGHMIVDPQERGRGFGKRLARLLLEHAFSRLSARRVSLVVFYENLAAIAAYRAAGLFPDGTESHEFPRLGRTVRLLRMATTRLD